MMFKFLVLNWLRSLALVALTVTLPALAQAAVVAAVTTTTDDYHARLIRILKTTPLIDGHNDLPWEIRERFKSNVTALDLAADTSKLPLAADASPLMTDIPRLRIGMLGGQFWSVWIPVTISGYEAVQTTLEEIDLVKRMSARYPADFEMAYTAADVRRIHRQGKIASLIGIEGGHQINNSLPVLRQMYDVGARYMTLTHTSNTAWADSATDNPVHHGLTAFGLEVVREMNRLGMLVDLSHVSPDTMRAALKVSEAPVMFSHSSARALVDHPRDVPDDILALVAKNHGVVMVNFCPCYVSAERNQWEADRSAEQARFSTPPYGGLYIGQPERVAAALKIWDEQHPRPVVTLQQVADHIDHVKQVAGVDSVGLGADFDGIPEGPTGLEGVDHYPDLLQELMRRGWSDEDVAKLAGENILRVMAAAEQVSVRLRASRPASEAKPDAATRAGVVTHYPIGDLKVTARTRIGKTADWVTVTADAVWVGSTGPFAVHRFEPSGRLVANVRLAGEPCAGLATGFGSLWIPLCGHPARLAQVDLRSNRLAHTFDIGPAAAEGGIAASPDSLWLVIDKHGSLARIDPATGALTQTVHIPAGSFNPHYSDGIIWITHSAGADVTAVDAVTGKVLTTVPTGPGPRFLTAGSGVIWTLNQGDGSLTRLDASNARSGSANVASSPAATSIALGTPGRGGDIAIGGGMVWTTMPKIPLSAIDTLTATLRCQWAGPGGDSLGIGHGAIWLTDYHAGSVSRIDLDDAVAQCKTHTAA